MLIIETCPECGADLMNYVIATYPPIPAKRCTKCGWTWEGEREEIQRVPFNSNNNTMYYPQVEGITPTVIKPKVAKEEAIKMLIQSFEDAGAEVKSGTGKIFCEGKEIDPIETLKAEFEPPEESK